MSEAQISSIKEDDFNVMKMEAIKSLADVKDVIIVKQINRLLKHYEENPYDGTKIVGSHPDGSPMTQAELDEDLERSFDDIENGRVLTFEEALKEAESWG